MGRSKIRCGWEVCVNLIQSVSHSHRMYATFWSLSLPDLYVPLGRYEEEITKQKQIIHDIEDNIDLVSVCVCMHVYMYACMCACMCVCTCMCVYVCVCVCVSVHFTLYY